MTAACSRERRAGARASTALVEGSILHRRAIIAVSSAMVFCVPKMTLSPPPIIPRDTWGERSGEETDKRVERRRQVLGLVVLYRVVFVHYGFKGMSVMPLSQHSSYVVPKDTVFAADMMTQLSAHTSQACSNEACLHYYVCMLRTCLPTGFMYCQCDGGPSYKRKTRHKKWLYTVFCSMYQQSVSEFCCSKSIASSTIINFFGDEAHCQEPAPPTIE